MNKLEKLIVQQCPNGVEYKELVEVCSDFIVPMRDRPQVFDGEIPWCRIEDIQGDSIHGSLSGLKVSMKVISDMNLKVMPTGTVIASCSASLGRYAITTTPLITNQTFIGLVCGERLLNRYLLHLLPLKTQELIALSNSGTIPYISRAKFEKLRIPVPPIEVQQEIVNILDFFSELVGELEAELEARKAQYVHYNQALLLIDESDAQQNILNVKDVCSEKFWLMPATPKYEIDGSIPYITSRNLSDGIIDFASHKMISQESFEKVSKNRKIQHDDVLIGMIGTIGEVARVKIDDLPFYGQNMYLLRLNQEVIDVNYFLQILNSNVTRAYFAGIKHNSSQGYLKAEHVEELKIPVPSLAEQRRIAKILDNLKSLTNDMTKGLPAEIKVRRQQYEYYRNKLLSFKELDVA